MISKPLIIFDPFPRNEDMVYTMDVKKELNEISNLVTHFGSRAPDHLIEKNLSEVAIIVGQTEMLKERLDKSPKLKAIINVKCNWEPNIDYFEAQRKGIYVLSAAPAMAPAVAEACVGYAISLSRGTLGVYKKFLKSEEQYGIKENLKAYTLFNSDVGFIGFGNLAKSLLPLLKPFNCNVSVFDPWLSKDYLESQGVKSSGLDDILSKNKFIFILAGVTSENVGFIGFGNLAKNLLPLLKPFNCNVSVYDPWLSKEYLESQGVNSVTLENLLSTNKFIFILAGVTSENKGFINKEKLKLIKKDSSVILVSRAEVLDFDTFIELAEQNCYRAAVDVFPEEPVPLDAPFRKESNILFTSHVAGALNFSYKNIREMMMNDIRQILKGLPPTCLQRAEPHRAILRRDR